MIEVLIYLFYWIINYRLRWLEMNIEELNELRDKVKQLEKGRNIVLEIQDKIKGLEEIEEVKDIYIY